MRLNIEINLNNIGMYGLLGLYHVKVTIVVLVACSTIARHYKQMVKAYWSIQP